MRCLVTVLLIAGCGTSAPPEPTVAPVPMVPPTPAPVVSVLQGLPCPEQLAVPDDASAATLTLTAYTCGNHGRLVEARALIDRAYPMAQTDPTTNYVMARILLASRQEDGNACEREAYMDAILNQLLVASTDPSLRAALTTQDLFAEARPALRYRVATGVDLASLTTAQAQGLRFYSRGNGAYGSAHKLLLAPGGVAMYSDLTVDEDGNAHWHGRRGTYTLQEGALVLDNETSYAIGANGVLSHGADMVKDWLDVPSECDG